MNEKLREALEAALVENPDDIAAHMAYADLLSDAGDPRGEFIQVQLALEDEACKGEARRRLQQREGRVAGEPCGSPAPSELRVPVSRHAAQAFSNGPRGPQPPSPPTPWWCSWR